MTAEPLIRPEQPDDAEVGPLIAAAFERPAVADLWAEVVADGLALAALVAELDGEVVGHVGLSRAWLDARRELVDVWMLSPLSVRPDLQRQGIGTRLLAAAVATAREGGAPMLVLEGGPTYYGARGFVPSGDHGVLPATDRTPPAASQLVLFEPYEEWMTGRIVYRDVWWRHDSAGLRDPRLAEVETRFRQSDQVPQAPRGSPGCPR